MIDTINIRGFKIDTEKCKGLMHCMRVCPTHAIRVKHGKTSLIPELCIDCGLCYGACPIGAISATTITFAELDTFKFKVAVASPVLFSQFSMKDTPSHVVKALLNFGFDAVWDFSVDIELINRATADCLKKWPGTFPLISNSCPVIVRLIQVAYPTLIEHLIPIEEPREIAARELKRKYSAELGLKPEEIAAIYIAPCQAKTISILQPAEAAKSYLDGAVGVSDIYNDIIHDIRKNARMDEGPMNVDSGNPARWGASEGEFPGLSSANYLRLTGMPDVIKVFDDIEKGKIHNLDFFECHACRGACIGGNLTVENLYVARSKKLHLMANTSESSAEFKKEVNRRYATEDFSLRGSIKPRRIEGEKVDLRQRVLRKRSADEILKKLPLLDCGLCGAPTCKTHADDVASFRSQLLDCVFLSPDRIDRLKNFYKK